MRTIFPFRGGGRERERRERRQGDWRGERTETKSTRERKGDGQRVVDKLGALRVRQVRKLFAYCDVLFEFFYITGRWWKAWTLQDIHRRVLVVVQVHARLGIYLS